jgi:Ser/Thr protein kinase RdoA (MazF antagonist)
VHLEWGFSNKVYAVTTTQGKYAVKALSPHNSDLEDAIITEKLVSIVGKRINAVPAKKFNDKIVQEIDGQLYLVFDWIEGKEVEYDDITPEHSRIMGSVVADIHTTDFSALNLSSEFTPRTHFVDWKSYVQKGEEAKAVWVEPLKKNIDMIQDYYAKAIESEAWLNQKKVISHKVLDPRQVVWQGYTPYLVDWEHAGMVNSLNDFINTAFHWSSHGTERDKDRFIAFARGYNAKNKFPAANWRNVLYKRYLEPLNWLAFNLERSLNNSDPEDQQVAIGQVESMIREAIRYSDKIEKLEKWLSQI